MTLPVSIDYAPTLVGDRRLPWADDALCAQTDPEVFNPDKGSTTLPAKSVCAACPVINQCLEYALATNQRFGVWGGKSERERRKILRERAA